MEKLSLDIEVFIKIHLIKKFVKFSKMVFLFE